MWKRAVAVMSPSVVIAGFLSVGWVSPASAAACSITPVAPSQSGGVYQLSSPGHLEWVKGGSDGSQTAQLASDFEMTQSIDMGDCEWSSVIGTGAPGNFFSGSFDGGGFVISGLNINGDLAYAGLFGGVGGSAQIQNLRFEGNVTNTTASSSGRTGGLIGGVFNTTQITNVHATGSVRGGDGDGVGGLVGYVSASGAVIAGSSATGDVRGDGIDVGGLVGFAQNLTVQDSFARGNVLEASDNAGGIIGRSQSGVSLTRSYATGTVADVTSDGGLVGAGSATTTDSYFDQTNNPTLSTPAGSPKTSAELQDIATFATWSIASGYDSSATWGICSAVNGGYPFLTRAYSSDPCTSGGGGLAGGGGSPITTYTLTLEPAEGSICTVASVTGRVNTWVSLPPATSCRPIDENSPSVLLGWATVKNFPVEIAQRQIDFGMGAYELTDDSGAITGVFIPSDGSAFIVAPNRLYAVWSEPLVVEELETPIPQSAISVSDAVPA